MKTRTKVIFDEWVGKSVVALLNIPACILDPILRIDHSLTKTPFLKSVYLLRSSVIFSNFNFFNTF